MDEILATQEQLKCFAMQTMQKSGCRHFPVCFFSLAIAALLSEAA